MNSGTARKTPPFLILFDVIFIYLFATILEPTPQIEIVQSNDGAWPSNVVIQDVSNNFYTYKYNSYKNIEEITNVHWLAVNCSWSEALCKQLHPEITDINNYRILVFGKLLDDIGTVSIQACLKEPVSCGNVVVYVSEDGRVDLQSTIAANQSLQVN